MLKPKVKKTEGRSDIVDGLGFDWWGGGGDKTAVTMQLVYRVQVVAVVKRQSSECCFTTIMFQCSGKQNL